MVERAAGVFAALSEIGGSKWGRGEGEPPLTLALSLKGRGDLKRRFLEVATDDRYNVGRTQEETPWWT